jgi:hypothetical protein
MVRHGRPNVKSGTEIAVRAIIPIRSFAVSATITIRTFACGRILPNRHSFPTETVRELHFYPICNNAQCETVRNQHMCTISNDARSADIRMRYPHVDVSCETCEHSSCCRARIYAARAMMQLTQDCRMCKFAVHARLPSRKKSRYKNGRVDFVPFCLRITHGLYPVMRHYSAHYRAGAPMLIPAR